MTRLAPRPPAAAVFGALLALALPAALPAVEVSGRVTDESEAPIAGARVTLHPAVSPAERGALWLSGRQHPPVVARARTGPDGGYRLVVPDSETHFWTVVARTAEHVPMERDVGPLFESSHLEAVRLVAREPTSVRVAGPGGEAVPGAAVLLRISPSSRRLTQGMGSWRPPAARVARTAEDGRAELTRAEGEDGRVQVVAPGRLAVADLEAARSGIALPAAGGDLLRLVDTDGEPAPGVLAWWAPDGLPALGEAVGRGFLPVERYRLVPVAAGGADGSLRLPAGLPGDATIRLAARDGSWASLPAADREPGPGTAAPIRLRAPVTLTGTVRERESGEPVAHALAWAESDRSSVARSDEEGRYRLTLPGPEATAVAAAGPRHQPASPEVAVFGESASDLVLVVEPVLTLTGRVESGDGSAIDGATIVAQPSVMTHEDRSEGCGRAQALSGEGGRFRLTGLTPHCDYHLRTWREGYATTWLDIPPLADDAPGYEPVRLVLVTGRNLIGRVVDPDGVPVPGARVEFRRYAPWGLHFSLPVMETQERVALADPDGFFDIEHLSGGARGRIVVEAHGFVPFERQRVEVSEELGETALGDLELEPERFLEIEVADADGRPIEDAEVTVYRSDPGELVGGNDSMTDSDARTDAAGRFRVGGFAAGDQAMLLVRKEGFVTGSLQNVGVPQDSPVRVVLEGESVITGRVVDTSGRPVTEARVSTEESAWLGRYAGSRVDDEGRFELGRLPAGPLRLRALGPEGERSDILRVELAAGERVDGLELVLRSRPRILGRVLAPDGAPVSQPRVVVRGGGRSEYCDSGEDGGFRCEGREPGTYTLAVHEDEVGQVEQRVVLGEADVTVDLHLEPELVIRGRVLTADGEPVAGRVVRVQPLAGGFFDSPRDNTGSDGSFTIRGIAEETYELLVGSPSDPTGLLTPHRHPEPIVVQDGLSVTDVEIRLERTTVLRGALYGLPDDQLARAIVGAEEVGAEGFPRTLGGEVESGGRYEIPGIGPGTWTVMAVGPERDAQARREIEILPGEVDPVLDLTLVRGVTLAGRVLLDGDPWSGAVVAMLKAAGTTRTDLGGRFELPGIPPGRQEILLAGGSPDAGMTMMIHEVDVEEGREVVIDVAAGVVRGVVTSPEMPLAGASVALSPVIPSLPDSFPLFPRVATTASDGSFVIERVPVGAYTISFGQPGYAPIHRELHVTSGEVELPPVILEPETR